MTGVTSLLTAVLCALSVGAGPQAVGGRITGRVVTTDIDPRPVRRAIVMLTGEGLPGGRATISDAEGRFAFDGLPAGRFTLAGRKPAFLPGAYGATRPGGPGIPLQLSAGQQATNVVLALARGAVITGALRDPAGEPMPNMTVAAFRVPAPGMPPRLDLVHHVETNDRGVYRMFGLMPGEYLVGSLQRTGRTRDVAAYPASAIDAILADLRRGARLPGTQTTSPGERPDAPSGSYAYAPVFYPGTASLDAAGSISLGVGEERTNVDFIVELTRMATIEGVLIDNGIPTKPLIINMSGLALDPTTGNAPTYYQERTASGLSFRYTNVLPGRYQITAESSEAGLAFARTEVLVTGGDVSGVTMVLQPALRMTGRIVFDGATLAPPDGPAAVSMRLTAATGSGAGAVGYTRIGNASVPPARITIDWRFELGGLMPDVYRLTATVTDPGWWLRSAVVNGVDILDRPLDAGSGDLTDAVVTFSDRRTTLSGAIFTGDGEPAPAYFMAVFPADRDLWHPLSRRMHLARTGTDGRWIVEGLPAGDYLLAALSDADQTDLYDPAFLASLVPNAVPVSIEEGDETVQDLQIRRVPN